MEKVIACGGSESVFQPEEKDRTRCGRTPSRVTQESKPPLLSSVGAGCSQAHSRHAAPTELERDLCACPVAC